MTEVRRTFPLNASVSWEVYRASDMLFMGWHADMKDAIKHAEECAISEVGTTFNLVQVVHTTAISFQSDTIKGPAKFKVKK